MSQCRHKTLILLKEKSDKVRCRHCHLVISADELDGGFCPECYAVRSERRKDFEKIDVKGDDITTYRCEECGAFIEWREEEK